MVKTVLIWMQEISLNIFYRFLRCERLPWGLLLQLLGFLLELGCMARYFVRKAYIWPYGIRLFSNLWQRLLVNF